LIELQKDNDTVKTILENEYHIPFRKISEEALGMCNLSSGIYDKGRAEGKAEGIAEGKAEGILSGKIDTVKNMLKEGMSLETALRFAGLDKDTYDKYVDKEN
jgi:predicted transposase YdaD